ncbi:MAG: SGNH/GDSL hydrolase family protein [Geminicoccaceae bacterium]
MAKSEVRSKRPLFFIAMMVIAIAVPLAFAEIFLRLFHPQAMMWPRLQFSPEYSVKMPPDTVMVNKMPGEWQFNYTVNADGYRGETVPITNTYEKDNIVILGDSYSFGLGVNDGEEFPAIMSEQLQSSHNIINLGSAGWGLGQQIRRYFEFGQLFRPSTVILQYSANDVPDNLYHAVTTVENERFTFVDSYVPLYWLKDRLSRSFIQHSQLYNFIRQNLYWYFRGQSLEDNLDRADTQNEDRKLVQTYNDLLTVFVEYLKSEGIGVMYIAVNDQLDFYPKVKDHVKALDDDGMIDYVEVADWFEGVTDYASPEGHYWGEKAHAIVGDKLADVISSLKSPDGQNAPDGENADDAPKESTI